MHPSAVAAFASYHPTGCLSASAACAHALIEQAPLYMLVENERAYAHVFWRTAVAMALTHLTPSVSSRCAKARQGLPRPESADMVVYV